MMLTKSSGTVLLYRTSSLLLENKKIIGAKRRNGNGNNSIGSSEIELFFSRKIRRDKARFLLVGDIESGWQNYGQNEVFKRRNIIG